MILKSSLKGKNVAYKKLNYANFFNGINADYDQFILPISYSVNTYNFSFNNGALTTGLGVGDVYLPASYLPTNNQQRKVEFDNDYQFIATWIYKKEHINVYGTPNISYDNWLFLQTADGNFYMSDICSDKNFILQINDLNLTEVPTIVNYNLNGVDSLLICSKNGMWVWNNQMFGATKVESAPKIKNMCLHYERIFACVEDHKNEVWFSDDLNPTNWNISLNEAGFIKFNDERGIVNRVLSFNDYVYAFREYGISRITAYANQTEFSVAQLFVSSGKIFGNSVCVCGDKILMLTQNGIYSFDGYSTVKLNLNIDKLLKNTNNHAVCSAYSNGKYYLACNLNFDDDEEILCEEGEFYNNALLELDLETNTLNILRGIDVRSLNAISDDKINKLIVCYYSNGKYVMGELGNFGKLFEQNLPKCWKSPLSDFGYPEKEKVVKDIYLKSNVPVTITVRTEKTVRQYNASPKNNLIHLRTLIKGNLIAIDFKTNSGECLISSPTVVVGFV